MENSNIYTERISRFYDQIVHSHYYDYIGLAKQLADLFGTKKELLEVGIGTGLAAEQMLSLGYRITGVDFSQEMLRICDKRLHGKANLCLKNIRDYKSKQKFDAAYSIGGAWYATANNQGEVQVMSYLHSIRDNILGLRNIATHLQKDGILALTIQKAHKNLHRLALDKVGYYTHHIKLEGAYLKKSYYVTKNKQVLAKQRCIFKVFGVGEFNQMLTSVGLSKIHFNDAKSLVYMEKNNSKARIFY